jgi:hypothetical protein
VLREELDTATHVGSAENQMRPEGIFTQNIPTSRNRLKPLSTHIKRQTFSHSAFQHQETVLNRCPPSQKRQTMEQKDKRTCDTLQDAYNEMLLSTRKTKLNIKTTKVLIKMIIGIITQHMKFQLL